MPHCFKAAAAGPKTKRENSDIYLVPIGIDEFPDSSDYDHYEQWVQRRGVLVATGLDEEEAQSQKDEIRGKFKLAGFEVSNGNLEGHFYWISSDGGMVKKIDQAETRALRIYPTRRRRDPTSGS